MGRLRRRATIARKGIVQILETARDYDLRGEEWLTLEREARVIAQELKQAERPDDMEMGVISLERRQHEARSRVEMLLKNINKTPSQSEYEPHQYTYKPSPYPEQDTVIASKTSSEAQEAPVPLSTAAEAPKRPEKEIVHGIRPDELVRFAPRLKPYLRRPNPTWPEIVEAADWLRHDLDVSKPLWGDACLTMGRELAAVALAIVSTKDPDHFRTTPGGYFHGMVQKAKADELHLERTVWAMRRATQPNARPRAGRGGDQYQ
jgi:replication initiation protein RepC